MTTSSGTKTFASQADLEVKKVTFSKLSDNAYAYTAEGDPNTGIIIGDDAVLVLDTQATPVMAQDVIRRIREVTDKPVQYVLLTHYHAVRVLGASAYGAQQIIASQDTRDLIVERGEQDKASEIGRFPRLFSNVETVPPGMTWPTMTFTGKMTLWLGKLEVQLLQLRRLFQQLFEVAELVLELREPFPQRVLRGDQLLKQLMPPRGANRFCVPGTRRTHAGMPKSVDPSNQNADHARVQVGIRRQDVDPREDTELSSIQVERHAPVGGADHSRSRHSRPHSDLLELRAQPGIVL